MPAQTATSWYQCCITRYNYLDTYHRIRSTDLKVDVCHIGPGQWDIWHSGGERVRLILAFNDIPHDLVQESTITDLGAVVESAKTLEKAKSALMKFLDQFEQVESRWPHRYEDGTEDLLSLYAQYQKDLLIRRSPISAKDFGEVIIVAQLLRALLLPSDLFDAEIDDTALRFLDGSDTCEIRPECKNEDGEIDSSITVRRYFEPRNSHTRSSKTGEPLGVAVLLRRAIADIQRLMLRSRSQDFPGFIYSLCLLELIAAVFRSRTEFMEHIIKVGENTTSAPILR